MARFVGLDVSQKLTSICVVDDAGRRLWRGQCHSEPEPIERAVRRHAGDGASIGIETGKSLDAHRTRALLGAGAHLVVITTRLSNHIRGVLKTFGMLPGCCMVAPLIEEQRNSNAF